MLLEDLKEAWREVNFKSIKYFFILGPPHNAVYLYVIVLLQVTRFYRDGANDIKIAIRYP